MISSSRTYFYCFKCFIFKARLSYIYNGFYMIHKILECLTIFPEQQVSAQVEDFWIFAIKIFSFLCLEVSVCLVLFQVPTVCLDAVFSSWVIHCFMSLHDYLLIIIIIIIIFFSLHSLLLLGVIGENVLLIQPFSLVLNSKAFLQLLCLLVGYVVSGRLSVAISK